MRVFSRTLIYILFIVVIFYLFALRAERARSVLLAEIPLSFLSPKAKPLSGEVIFKRRGDGSEYILIKLNNRVPEKALVLLVGKDGIAREVGRFEGATFLSTLPRGISFSKISRVEIKLAGSGQMLAEARLTEKN